MVRTHKSQPTEVSSKQPVSVLRDTVPVSKKKPMDPRFDRACGHFNPDLFAKSYTFVGEMQEGERRQMEKAVKKESDPYRRAKLKSTLDRLNSMQRSNERQKEHQRIIREHRKLEAKLVEQGKKPYFLKAGDVRKLELAGEYERLKNKLGSQVDFEKFLEKKRKKKASRQRKQMPFADPA